MKATNADTQFLVVLESPARIRRLGSSLRAAARRLGVLSVSKLDECSASRERRHRCRLARHQRLHAADSVWLADRSLPTLAHRAAFVTHRTTGRRCPGSV